MNTPYNPKLEDIKRHINTKNAMILLTGIIIGIILQTILITITK